MGRHLQGEWDNLWLARGIDVRPGKSSYMLEVNGVSGYLMEGDVDYIYRMAAALPRAGRYVEIGSLMGLSTILAANALAASLNFDARIYAVDCWDDNMDGYGELLELEGRPLLNVFLDNVRAAKVEHFIVPLQGKSTNMAKCFHDSSLDMIFVDDSHTEHDCLQDLRAWYPKKKPGGIMFGHDASPEPSGVRKAVEIFCNENGLEADITEPPAAHYMWCLR